MLVNPAFIGLILSLLSTPVVGLVLSFLGRANIADRQLTEHDYPRAQVYRIIGTANEPSSAGYTDPNTINHIRVIFKPNKTNQTGRVVIDETNFGEFGAPRYYAPPWTEPDRPFTFTSTVPSWIDLATAMRRVSSAGYGSAIRNVTIRWYNSAKQTEAQYYFAMANNRTFVLVGAVSGNVTKF